MTILQHILVFFLIVATPLWDRYEIPRLRASKEPRKKLRFYRQIIIASWVCAVIAVLTAGLAQVFGAGSASAEISWLNPRSRGGMFIGGVTAGIFIAILIPAVFALRSENIRAKAARVAHKLSFILPSTGEERGWWWLVCITAGICEEIVYRGFLLHYFHLFPFHLSVVWALVISSLIFGIGHLYQGVTGGISTAGIGFATGLIFLMSGNLLLPIVVHAVMDLRALALLPEGFELAEV